MRLPNKRPSIQETMIQIAMVLTQRSTCKRRAVGCVITDVHNQILSTGYNGVPRNFKHCTDNPCPGANKTSGTGLDECQAVHAEVNAIAQCPNILAAHNLYCTTAPCISCIKTLINTGIKDIFYNNEYPHIPKARDMWQNSLPGRRFIYVGSTPPKY